MTWGVAATKIKVKNPGGSSFHVYNTRVLTTAE